MRDPETGNSKGFGFVSYSSFQGSDAAVEVAYATPLCHTCRLWSFRSVISYELIRELILAFCGPFTSTGTMVRARLLVPLPQP